MTKKILIIASFLFIASVLVMTFAIPNCGLNGFYVGLPGSMKECHNEMGLMHIDKMANFLLSGNTVSIFLLFIVVFSIIVSIRSSELKLDKVPVLNDYFSRTVIGRLKPFDKLLLAYKRGIIQSLTFCRT